MDGFSRDELNKTKSFTSKKSKGRLEYELYLLQRHLQILNIIINNEPIGIIRLSNLSHFPQHKVRYSLRILEQEGLIRPSVDGAVTTKKFMTFIPNLNEILTKLEKTIQTINKSAKER